MNGINELIGVGTIFTLALQFFLLLLTFGRAVVNRLNVKRFKLCYNSAVFSGTFLQTSMHF